MTELGSVPGEHILTQELLEKNYICNNDCFGKPKDTVIQRGEIILYHEINCISKTMSNKEKLVTKMAQGHSPWPSFRETW